MKKHGFTLVEIVVSLALMAILLLTVLGVFIAGGNAIKKGRSSIIAVNVAEKKIAEMQNLIAKYPSYDMTIDPTAITENIEGDLSPAPVAVKIWDSSHSSMPYTITGIEHMEGKGDYKFTISLEDYISPSLGTVYDIKKITVTVNWTDPPSNEIKTLKINNLISKEGAK